MEDKQEKLKFSVLMSVYNKEKPKYLSEALKSIFTQTLMPNQVVLVKDGPLTDQLDKVIEVFKKKYPDLLDIVVMKTNSGLGKALNYGLKHCKYNYVARMDTDDISCENRFEKQLKVFRTQNVDVVGSNICEYDENMQTVFGQRKLPQNDEDIKKMVKKRNPMNHVTVIYKKSSILEAGSYKDMPYFEDYYLWARMIKNKCIFYNIQEDLVKVRGGESMLDRRGGNKYIKQIINFEKELYKLKIITLYQFIYNVIIRTVISIVPLEIRKKFYKKILRN